MPCTTLQTPALLVCTLLRSGAMVSYTVRCMVWLVPPNGGQGSVVVSMRSRLHCVLFTITQRVLCDTMFPTFHGSGSTWVMISCSV